MNPAPGIDHAFNDSCWCVTLHQLFTGPNTTQQQQQQQEQQQQQQHFSESLSQCVIGNYMINLPWLLAQLPLLTLTPCLIFHGERDMNSHAAMCASPS